MKTIDKIITKCSTKYGAPMGRNNVGTAPKGMRIYNCAVPMSSDGAYDKGGAYWGHGAQLRVKYTKDLSYVEFYRVEPAEPFKVHGTYLVSNWGGYEIQLDAAGEMARMRDSFGSDAPGKISDWLPIEDVDGEQTIDPKGYNIPLSEVMKGGETA